MRRFILFVVLPFLIGWFIGGAAFTWIYFPGMK